MPLANSRLISRKGPMKGVKAVAFAPFLASTPVVNTATGVLVLPAIMTTPPAIVRVEVRATGNNYLDTGTFDEATRTTEFVAVNTFFIPGNDIVLRTGLQGNDGILQTIFIEDYNGKVYVQGAKNGADTMTLVNGSDTQGFAVTINSKETEAMFELSPAAVTLYLAAIKPVV
jgi:hypothetical protein